MSRNSRLNRQVREAQKRARARRRTQPRGLRPGESVSFWVPLHSSEVEAFRQVLSASLPGWGVQIDHPGLDKQEPPEVAASEGSTTTTSSREDSSGRSI